MKVLARQSLLDIAVQGCGSIESVFELAVANGIGITDEPTANIGLTLPEVVNQEVVDHFSINELKPATAITDDQYNDTISQEGIEYWIIETDFVVS